MAKVILQAEIWRGAVTVNGKAENLKITLVGNDKDLKKLVSEVNTAAEEFKGAL